MQLVTVYLEEQHTTLDLDLYLVFFVLLNMSIQYELHIKDQFFSYGKTVIIGFNYLSKKERKKEVVIGFTFLIFPLRKVVFKSNICYDFRIKIIIYLQVISAMHFVI
jgi:hypothetical protein